MPLRSEAQLAHSIAVGIILPTVALARDGVRLRDRSRGRNDGLARMFEAFLLIGRPKG